MSRRVMWVAPLAGAACILSVTLWVELIARHFWNGSTILDGYTR